MKIIQTDNFLKLAKKKSKGKKKWNPNPFAVCTVSTGREDKDKYERCVMDVKKKQNKKADAPLKSRWDLRHRFIPDAPPPFNPKNQLSSVLQQIRNQFGDKMYQEDIFKDPALQSLTQQVDDAWKEGEQTGKWSSFGRKVDELKNKWIELLQTKV